MRLMLSTVLVTAIAAGAAHATTVNDPTGDFLPTFVGTQSGELDIKSFTVTFDSANSAFDFAATFAGAIDTTHTNFYVIGVDTGAGAMHPFAGIGEGNVVFDQAIAIRSSGVTTLGVNTLSANISGNTLSLVVPTALLPSTGFATPQDFAFSFWSRNGLGNNNQNADFAPDNATVTAVPEPAAWALMICGAGMAGAALRSGRRPRRQPSLQVARARRSIQR